jgi:leucyl-tRNA synthetase
MKKKTSLKLKEEISKTLGDKELRSFKKEFKRIKKLIDEENDDVDRNAIATLRALLAMSVDLMPKIEEQAHKYKNERAVYALVALTNQIREILNDMRALSPRSQISNRVIVDVLDPNLGLMTQFIVAELATLKQTMYPELSGNTRKKFNDSLDRLKTNYIDYMLQIRITIQEQISKMLEAK